jgi:hypothetical protein
LQFEDGLSIQGKLMNVVVRLTNSFSASRLLSLPRGPFLPNMGVGASDGDTSSLSVLQGAPPWLHHPVEFRRHPQTSADFRRHSSSIAPQSRLQAIDVAQASNSVTSNVF